MRKTQYRIRRLSCKLRSSQRRLPDRTCQRNRLVFELLVRRLERRYAWPGEDRTSEVERRRELQLQARFLRRQQALRRLRQVEEEAEKLGGLCGPIQPAQQVVSARIDRCLAELEE